MHAQNAHAVFYVAFVKSVRPGENHCANAFKRIKCVIASLVMMKNAQLQSRYLWSRELLQRSARGPNPGSIDLAILTDHKQMHILCIHMHASFQYGTIEKMFVNHKAPPRTHRECNGLSSTRVACARVCL